MKSIFKLLCVTASTWLLATPLGAQPVLRDPTRPSEISPPPVVSAPSNGLPDGNPNGDYVLAPISPPERLGVLLIGSSRQYAVIDGVVVKPGQSVNQWRLLSIHSQGVVMQSASGTQTLKVSPSVVKTLRSADRADQGADTRDHKPTRRSP
ncbi:hypothetical protein [Limnohabitans sp. JirII-31]|uniref:hypothetical protein n=1 Tax=Limnohabitans sp. JirII-31 TaxID=1977908 RepID=UPI000C1EE45B|nr:hypothetical protein [Limnohabitans sp. JirII-31]